MKILSFAFIALIHFGFITNLHSQEVEKLVILGAGPAGTAAAIFGGQAHLNPLVIQDDDCNSQMSLIHKIDNYPGVLEEIDGIDLLTKFRQQASFFGARFVEDSTVEVDVKNQPFRIKFASGKTVYTQTLIIASGTVKKWLDLPNEQLLRGKGVVSATFCKDTDFQDKNIAVIGGGHAALQEAIHLSDWAKHITIINRGSKFNASKFHQDAVFEKSNIDIMYNTEVNKILESQDQVTGLELRSSTSQKKESKPFEIVIVAIGNRPNTDLFKDQLALTSSGHIVINGKNSSTNIPGVFAAGDVTEVAYGRVVIAAGAGGMAALDAIRYLDSKG